MNPTPLNDEAELPKRPPTALAIFRDSISAAVKAQNPTMSKSEFKAAISAQWKQLSKGQKLVYETQHKTMIDRWHEDVRLLQGMPPKLPDGAVAKKPTSAYMFFSKDARDKILAEYPNYRLVDIGRKTGELWRNLPAAQKKPYEDRSAADLKRYYGQIGKVPRVKRTMVGPRKPRTAYQIFAVKKRNTVRNSIKPTPTFGEMGTHMSELWKSLTDSQRKVYEKEAVEDRKRYERELASLPSDKQSTLKPHKARKPRLATTPKIPPVKSPLQFYMEARRAELGPSPDETDMTNKERDGLMTAEWNSLPSVDKKMFQDMNLRALEKHQEGKREASQSVNMQAAMPQAPMPVEPRGDPHPLLMHQAVSDDVPMTAQIPIVVQSGPEPGVLGAISRYGHVRDTGHGGTTQSLPSSDRDPVVGNAPMGDGVLLDDPESFFAET